MPSALSAIGYLLVAPFMTLLLSVLGGLAVVTSVLTSSFISIKLALIAIEFSIGIAFCSIRQLFSWLLFEPTSQILSRGRQKPNRQHTSSLSSSSWMRDPRFPPSDIHISFKAPIKSMYSLSVPTTPELSPHHHGLSI
ncbi:hypothetical protein BX666DRAFT_1914449 [Dichotomocladium elegans]|nr:hypothetical protein BX666DRAFT_1914449 [Dichotomocladium elegans]